MNEYVSRTHAFWRWLSGGLVVAALAAFAIHRQGEPDREMRGMPASERRALYQRTLETLQDACPRATGPTLKEHCREQAAFIEHFPECDNTCRALVAHLTPSPSR